MYLKNILIFFLIAANISTPLIVKAQQDKTLKKFEGYYQFKSEKSLYFQIITMGGELKQVRLWDGREMMLHQDSELVFSNPDRHFQINFSKNKQGEVSEAEVGNDHWEKVYDYVPENALLLDSAQIKLALDQKAKELVKAINLSTENSLIHFVDENFTDEYKHRERQNFIQQSFLTYRLTGGVKFSKCSYFSTHALYGENQYISEELGATYEFSLKLNPHLKFTLFQGRVIPNQLLKNNPVTEKELTNKLGSIFKSLTDKDIFSGAILLAKKDSILFQYVSGDAIKESNIKNTLNTRFNLGSMNKMFTAVAVMQLTEKGKLILNDPIFKYLDTTWMPKRLSDKIKIRHLLSHTSGMGDIFSQKFEAAPDSLFRTLDGYKPFIKINELNFEPGTNWLYSNAGMILLGAIIEKASGLDYFEYVKRFIYEPSGMKDSDERNQNLQKGSTAMGYIPQPDGSYHNNLHSTYIRASPAGGGYSTIGDLHQFAKALMSGKLISDSSKSMMFADVIYHQYGYGFQLWGNKTQQIVGHSGGAPGVSAIEYLFLNNGYIVIVLSNYDWGGFEPGEYLLSQVQSITNKSE